jgi:hypothetical protein
MLLKMNKRNAGRFNRIVIVIIVLLQAIGVSGQTGKYSLKWLDNKSITTKLKGNTIIRKYLSFEGANYSDGNLIPYYTSVFKISNNLSEANYKIINLAFQTIPDTLRKQVELPNNLTYLTPEINIYKAGNERDLVIKLNTVRKNEINNKYEFLKSFEIVASDSIIHDKSFLKVDRETKSVQSSVLSSGYWYKVKVYKSGIYKITYSDLVNLGFTNLSNIRIFGNGGKQLSYWNSIPRPLDLQECPIYINKGSDGIFNDGDYILFYAEGPVTWYYDNTYKIFRQTLHGYSDGSYYFLTTDLGEGQKIPTVDNRNLVSNLDVNSYNTYGYYKKNLLNLIGSGRGWYTLQFDSQPFDTTFQFQGLEANQQIFVNVGLAGRSESTRSVNLKINDKIVATQSIDRVNFSPVWSTFANAVQFKYSYYPTGNQVKVGVQYNKVDLTDNAYLDYITVNARCVLSMTQNPLFFRDINSVDSGGVAKFTVENVNDDVSVWDITDVNNVFAIEGEKIGTTYDFKATTDNLHEYVLLNTGINYPEPVMDKAIKGVGVVPNQNLHNLPVYNYIIVTNEAFADLADSIAGYYRENSDLSVYVVTPELIYNEFSSGAPDVSALRDFFKNQYDRGSGTDKLRYVLLLGDGSFNNHMYVDGNTNYILTYQSLNALDPTSSYVTDDFFGLLDNNEGESSGLLDIGIGRLPLKLNNGDNTEARGVVDKILKFYRSDLKDWRGTLTFTADDGYDDAGSIDDTTFSYQANTLAEMSDKNRPGFDLKKIYLDAYTQVTSTSGPTYPDATDELIRTINKGTLLVSYTGHGSEYGLASEKFLQIQDINSLTNGELLPVFLTATCEFSRFDEVTMQGNIITPKTSGGEFLLLNSAGGAAALLSTTRVVYAGENFALGKNVINEIFKKDSLGKRQRLGDIVKKAKNQLGPNINKLNFTILGDPAMIIQYPEYRVLTDSINHISVNEGIDTLKAFSKVTVSGYIGYDDSTIISNFNGIVYPSIYDKPVKVTTLGNDNQDPFTYLDQNNLLYKGRASVINGRFKFSFIVPKDISYSIDKGKISYYAENGKIDAMGEFKNVFIGGTDNNFVPDNNGPDVHLFMNDTLFKDGDITNSNPHLLGILNDEYGINTTGIGIGHDITAYLDNDVNNLYLLNDYYQAYTDNYASGQVFYPLLNIPEGEHQLTLKAWDVFNNSAEATIKFNVVSSGGLVLGNITSYPNPANDHTIFQYTHNSPGELHDVVLQVFDISGRLVVSKSRKIYESGFVSTPFEWDLKASSGNTLQSGVYPYQLKVTTSLGTSYLNQKLIIIR